MGMARDSCLARVTAGVAIGGAVGGAVGMPSTTRTPFPLMFLFRGCLKTLNLMFPLNGDCNVAGSFWQSSQRFRSYICSIYRCIFCCWRWCFCSGGVVRAIFCRSVVLRYWMELCVNLWSLDLSWGRKRMASYGVAFCWVCFDYTLGFLSMGFPVLLESRVTQCISRVSIFTSAMKNFAYESCFIFNIWNKT